MSQRRIAHMRPGWSAHGLAVVTCLLLAFTARGQNLCCSSNLGPGCNNAGCQAVICAADAYCCNVAWDILCSDAAVANANASGACAGVSNCPGQPPGPCLYTLYSVTLTGGTYPTEVSWQLIGPGGTVGSGGAPGTWQVCMQPGCYVMHLYDTFGDGWNGATYTIRVLPANTVVASGTLATGSYGANMISIGGEPCDTPVTASDCADAVNVCTDLNFMIDPNGFGSTNDVPPSGSFGNPSFGTWGLSMEGCLKAGELNSTWMVINIWQSGWLEFTFGGLGTQAGFYDWAMWPYDPNACTAIASNLVAPVACNWNYEDVGGTGLAFTPPAGGFAWNFDAPIWATEGEQYIVCFSNWSSVTTAVPLVFNEAPGNAVVDCQDVTLPVELVMFEARAAAQEVVLNWTTSTEVNTAHFIVERSRDLVNWHEIGLVDAAGHSATPIDYVHSDPGPVPGMNYYRLRVVDTDGTVDIGPVREVEWAAERRAVFPNPSSDGRLWVTRRGAHIGVDVFDAHGRQVPHVVLNAYDTQVQIDLGPRAQGMYTVRIGTDRSYYSERVIIGR